MPELKPCPFCGQTPKMEESARFPRYGKDAGKRIKGYTVVCQNMYCILHNEDNWYRRSGKEACEAWNHRAEPEMRPLTLAEVKSHCAKGSDAEPLYIEFSRRTTLSRWILVAPNIECNEPATVTRYLDIWEHDYGKTWRCWPRKPTPEQMEAAEWEE